MPQFVSNAIQWVVFAWHSLIAVVTDPALVPALELLCLVFVLIFVLVRLAAQKKSKPVEFHSSRNKIKTFTSRDGNTTVRMTDKYISEKKLTKGQTIMLVIAQAGENDIQEVGVTVDSRRPHGDQFGDGDIEISLKAMELMGADQAKTISSAKLRPPPFGIKKIMLQSFNHPDQNVRLAWLLSLWSLIVGTAISHFHILFPK